MKIEDQVVSLDLSKRLEKLGFKQDSLFVWIMSGIDFVIVPIKEQSKLSGCLDDIYSAYTVAELGEILPQGYIEIRKIDNGNWRVDYTKTYYFEQFEAGTMADSMAKMLIYLKENNLI